MAQEVVNIGTGPDTPGADSQYEAHRKHKANVAELYNELAAAAQQVEVAAGQTLSITRATHQAATFTLAGTGSSISFSATVQGAGFIFTVYNETGGDWTIPTFTGGTNRYPENVAHTKLKNGGVGSFETIMQGGQLRVRINGDTA